MVVRRAVEEARKILHALGEFARREADAAYLEGFLLEIRAAEGALDDLVAGRH